MNEIERIARYIAKNFYVGYNEGFCSALGYTFKGDVTHLVNRNWNCFVKDAKRLKKELL